MQRFFSSPTLTMFDAMFSTSQGNHTKRGTGLKFCRKKRIRETKGKEKRVWGIKVAWRQEINDVLVSLKLVSLSLKKDDASPFNTTMSFFEDSCSSSYSFSKKKVFMHHFSWESGDPFVRHETKGRFSSWSSLSLCLVVVMSERIEGTKNVSSRRYSLGKKNKKWID